MLINNSELDYLSQSIYNQIYMKCFEGASFNCCELYEMAVNVRICHIYVKSDLFVGIILNDSMISL